MKILLIQFKEYRFENNYIVHNQVEMYFTFQKLSTFITPFVNYRKATELLNRHGNNDYHLLSAEKISTFIDNYSSNKSVKKILNKKSMAILDKNKKK